MHAKVFYIQVWFKCETLLLFFLIEAMATEKTLYRRKQVLSANYVKINELYVVHTWRHMQSESKK